jgi:hypothetical protein
VSAALALTQDAPDVLKPISGPTRIRCDDDCPRCALEQPHEAFREVWPAEGPARDRTGELFATGEILGAMQVKRGSAAFMGAMRDVTIIEYIRRVQ